MADVLGIEVASHLSSPIKEFNRLLEGFVYYIDESKYSTLVRSEHFKNLSLLVNFRIIYTLVFNKG